MNLILVNCWNQMNFLMGMEMFEQAKEWCDLCLVFQKQLQLASQISFEEAINHL